MGLSSPTALAYCSIRAASTSNEAGGHSFPIASVFTAMAAGILCRLIGLAAEALGGRERRLAIGVVVEPRRLVVVNLVELGDPHLDLDPTPRPSPELAHGDHFVVLTDEVDALQLEPELLPRLGPLSCPPQEAVVAAVGPCVRQLWRRVDLDVLVELLEHRLDVAAVVSIDAPARELRKLPLPTFLHRYFPPSSSSTDRKASCGTSTRPTCFIRFFPAFCFSSSFRLRVTSPP